MNKNTSREGCNNPMWGKHHSAITRQKQSFSAIRRNQKAKDSQHHITMDEFLSNNPTLANYIKEIVKEEISKYLSMK